MLSHAKGLQKNRQVAAAARGFARTRLAFACASEITRVSKWTNIVDFSKTHASGDPNLTRVFRVGYASHNDSAKGHSSSTQVFSILNPLAMALSLRSSTVNL
jgi:hypothetical protein